MKSDDVLAGWKTLWDADSSLGSLVPGGLSFERVPSEKGSPYGILACEEGDREWTGKTSWIQPFTITVQVWSAAGPVDAGAIFDRVHEVFKRSTKSNLVVTGATRTVDLVPLPGKVTTEQTMRQGKDVLISMGKWKVVLQF